MSEAAGARDIDGGALEDGTEAEGVTGAREGGAAGAAGAALLGTIAAGAAVVRPACTAVRLTAGLGARMGATTGAVKLVTASGTPKSPK